MRKFIASNYSMGRPVQTIKIDAPNNRVACAEAERRMPSANALPGSAPGAASKARVIGVRYA